MAFFKCNSFYELMSSLHEAESRRGFLPLSAPVILSGGVQVK